MSLDDDEAVREQTCFVRSTYHSRPLCSAELQPRQFEFHPLLNIMAVGTCEGDVVVLDWEKNKILQRRVFDDTEKDLRERKSILALSWLRKNPRLLLAGSSSGKAKLYKLVEGGLDVALEYGSQPLTEEMTSIHCNCEDTLLVTSGYTKNVNIFSVETGQLVREYKGIHGDHINICRFANNLPNILLTCSFDNTIKLWDNRCHHQSPIHVSRSEGGNVMVCFSPDDMYYLSSAVDNEVKQYQTVDGRLHLNYDIKPIHSSINYTRSYYANGGDLVVSGSSNDDVVHICCSSTGKIINSIRMYEGRRHPNLYIQSLRGNPIESNRFGVLVCYRYSNTPYEVVDVNLNKDAEGQRVELPYSIAVASELIADLSQQFESPSFHDLELLCFDGKRVHAHKSILTPRWPWLRNHMHLLTTSDGKIYEMKMQDLSKQVLRTIVKFLYTGNLDVEIDRVSGSEIFIRQLFSKCGPNKYNLPRLRDLVELFLRERMKLGNAIDLLEFSCSAGAKRLYEACVDFISRCLQFYECNIGFDSLKRRIGKKNFERILKRKMHSRHRPRSPGVPYFKGRTAHTTTQIGRWVYLLGGYYSKGTQDLRCVPVFDTHLLEWTLLPTYGDTENVPEKLCFHSAAQLGHRLLAFGGGLKDDFKNDLYSLDLKTMTWRLLKPSGKIPCERKRHSAVNITGEMWIFGGRGRGPEHKRLLNDMHKYDFLQNRWTEVVTFGDKPSPRCGHTMTYLNHLNKIVIIGGFTNSGLVEDGMVHALDLQALNWTEIKTPSPRPPPRCCHTSTVIRWCGELCIAIFGGSTSSAFSNGNNIYLSDMCILETTSGSTPVSSTTGWRWRYVMIPRTNDDIPPRFTHSAFLTFGQGLDVKSGKCEIDPGTRLLIHKNMEAKLGNLTIWAGGNNEDFLDDMWTLSPRQGCWVRTRYSVSGSLPEPQFKTLPARLPNDLKAAIMNQMVKRKIVRSRSRSPKLHKPSPGSSPLSDVGMEVTTARPMPTVSFDFSLGSSHSVTFIIEGHHVCVCKDVLAARSKQFRTMFNSKMRESRDRIVELPDVRLNVFLYIVNYLYTGDIPTDLTPTTHRLRNIANQSREVEGSTLPFEWSFILPTAVPDRSRERLRVERVPTRKRKNGSHSSRKVKSTKSQPIGMEAESKAWDMKPYQGGVAKDTDSVEGAEPSPDITEHRSDRKLSSSSLGSNGRQKMSPKGRAPMDVQDLKQVLIETMSRPDIKSTRQDTLDRKTGSGQPKIPAEADSINPLEVLVVADRFALDGLCDLMQAAISKNITNFNVCYLLKFAEFYNMKRLLNSAIMHVITNCRSVTSLSSYKAVDVSIRQMIEEKYKGLKVNVNSEDPKWI